MLVARGATVAQVVDQSRVDVQLLVLVLREVIGLGVVAERVLAGSERLGARQNLDQGGLPRPVHAHQRHAVAALDGEVHAREDRLIAVAFRHILELRHDAAARLRLRKAEVDGLLLGRDLDALDALQLLDAALHLLGLGGLITEAADESFQLLDAVLLVGVGGFELRQALGLLLLVAGVAAGVEVHALVP